MKQQNKLTFRLNKLVRKEKQGCFMHVCFRKRTSNRQKRNA